VEANRSFCGPRHQDGAALGAGVRTSPYIGPKSEGMSQYSHFVRRFRSGCAKPHHAELGPPDFIRPAHQANLLPGFSFCGADL
jgi:hypothetical protein